MSGESGKLFSFHNVGLFSDHFLTKRLPTEAPLWSSEKASAEAAFAKILAQYKKFKSTYKQPNEAQTEDDFIRPVLSILGYSYIVQTPLKHKGKFNQPDYSLFADEKTKKEAGSFKVKEQEAFYSKALAICDAKYWARPLDVKLSDKKDTFTNINPSFQIVNYLVGANVDWGILTNGKLWRLYYQKASSRSSNFYETDLEDLLLKGDPEKFLYFYLFFRKEAFLKDSQGKSFLDNVLEGSTHYATELSDRLKERVFEEIFPHLARGFLHYRKAEQRIKEETEEALKDIYNGTLTLLYRLLFILYAEARDLLPVKEPAYFHYSLANIKQKVAELRDKKATLSELSTDIWSDLDTLFKIIDVGDPKLNVPTYNGGLFSQKNPKNDFLKTNKVPDPWLVEAIDHLTREIEKESGNPHFVDYSELEVRHLGSIYEGLLEFHLKIADEDKALVKEKGREVYKPVADVKNPKGIVQKGELYLENDKHERKSTGSYYTPDYIVKYIVQNAIGPVLEKKLKKVERLFTEIALLSAKAKRATISRAAQTDHLKARKQQSTDELFSLKVLDPAMGSGHFLVETVDFLSDYIIKFLNDHPDNPVLEEIENLRSTILGDLKEKGIHIDEQKLTPTNLVRRMVMKRSIYGVDLNPMAVELAKLSLWLHSFTLGAPLSFLDHHLKCGNSLIGITEIGKVIPPGSEKEAEIKRILQNIVSISQLTDSTPSEVEESYKLYEDVLKRQEPFKKRSHISVAAFFLPSITPENLGRIEQLAELGDLSKAHPDHIQLYREALKVANQKAFFHWPLEFPELFFLPGREHSDSGFDAVIGNPPYVRIQSADKADTSYLKQAYKTAVKNFDIYIPFTEKGLRLLNSHGQFGFIVPNKFFQAEYGEGLRKLLTDGKHIAQVFNFGDNQVFSGSPATNYTCLLFLSHGPQKEFLYYEVASLSDVHSQLPPILINPAGSEFVRRGPFETSPLGSQPWSFALGQEQGILAKANAAGVRLGTVTEQIFQGLITSADHIYILEKRGSGSQPGLMRVYSFSRECELDLEAPLLKPLVSGEDIERYGSPEPRYVLLFPYELREGGGAELIPPERFENQYRLGWEYLKKHEDKLRTRESKDGEPAKAEITDVGEQDKGKFDDDKWYRFGRHQNLDKHERPKFGCAETVKNLEFAFDADGEFYFHNVRVNGVLLQSSNVRENLYLLALLNSRLLDFIFKKGSMRHRGGHYAANKQFIEPLPIRRITFTTSVKDRAQLLEKGTALYGRCLAKNDLLCVTSLVDNCLKQKPERADVVHDLLAFLAERMMEMNKEKQAETKGFLEWLEANIGAKVDGLKNKTRITAYHEGSLEDLLEILKENRKALKINPASKEFFDPLKDAFQKSLAKLSPLKANLATTDRLIDLIVYQLYGLTEEEIKVVEGEQN